MGTDEVVAWLEEVEKIDTLIKGKEDKISEIMDLATKITASIDGMPRGGGGISDKVGDNALKLAVLSKEKEDLEKQKNYIIKTLQKLPVNEFKVLYREYVLYMNQKEIAVDLHYTRFTIRRIKQKALKSLGEILKVAT